MDRTNTAGTHNPATATVERSSNTHLDRLLQKLTELEAPRPTPHDLASCHDARIQAVQWFNRLETNDQLDHLWPRFERWLAKRPENLEMYLTVERTCWTLEELRRWCPPEDSDAAQELLRLGREEPVPLKSRIAPAARRIIVATAVITNLIALYLIVR
jgi:ferric-dicitrate binding protein FerR (iron transport regulator)